MEALCAFPRQLARVRTHVTLTQFGIALLLIGSGMAQQSQQTGIAAGDPQFHSAVLPVSLKDLIGEAEQNSPEIAVAERGYTAATHVARQVSALPDTQVTLQQFAVGSPRPFAGYTNSEFAYVGLGRTASSPTSVWVPLRRSHIPESAACAAKWLTARPMCAASKLSRCAGW